MIKRSLAVILFFLTVAAVFAGDGYKIRISISGYPDSALLLTSYYGDKIVLVDTAYAQKPGTFVFTGKEKLPGGIYMAVSQGKSKLFEFIIDKHQDFSISTDTANYLNDIRVKGSPENKIFFNYVHFNEKEYLKISELQESLQKANPESASYGKLKNQIDSINRLVGSYKLNIIKTKPGLFVATLFNAMREVTVPDSVKQSADSSAVYHYVKNHYFDDFNLSDDRLLRTPLYSNKVNDYFDHFIFVHPDSAIVAVDYLIGKARPDSITTNWMVWHFISKYQEPKYMGFDKVFVHIADQYFISQNITNTTPSVIEQVKKRADAIRPLLLGKPAPNLIVMDTAGTYTSFLNLKNKYIVLLFWDYDCGVCKKEIVELKKIYAQRGIDFEIFAINVNSNLEQWKKTIKERKMDWVNVNGTRSVTQDFHDLYDIHGTPAIFILDKDRKIIAKHLSAKQILPFLEKMEQVK